MKKILPITLVCILLVNIFGAIIIAGTGPHDMDASYHISVPPLMINGYDEYYYHLSFENSGHLPERDSMHGIPLPSEQGESWQTHSLLRIEQPGENRNR